MTCYFPAGYKVTFDGDDLGQEILEFLPSMRFATPENVRHNFWSPTATLDMTYPAFVWEHNFLIYNEKVTRGQYAKDLFDTIRTCTTSRAMNLYILNKTTREEILAMGKCIFVGAEQDTPKELLRYEAGLFRMKFLGTSVPSLVSSY